MHVRRVAVAGVVLVVLATVVVFVTLRLGSSGARSRLTVTVAGRSVQLAEGTTLGRAAVLLRLRPRAGNLLDVEGQVLQRGAVAGKLLLDNDAVPADTRLRSGERISVVDGRDRREPLSRQLVHVAGGIPADPQFTLTRAPGSELVVRGRVSHKLVLVRFHPSAGPARVERAVALTFDDGPSPQYTRRILATLRRLHVHATFFVIGYLADAYPDLIRDELRAGMTVGNHSYNHPEVPPFDQLPPRLLHDEIELGAQSLRRAGASPLLFRPPGGSFSPAVVRAAEQRGERIVLWSVDPRDWQPGATARQIARNVLAAVRPGSIIELHDGGGNRNATVAALPAIVRGIRHRGLRLVALAA
jgi:peptidoglycan/xylan/chitin deacetylase (PgdA/CDA1 family)/sulfur carrier protein ThiS